MTYEVPATAKRAAAKEDDGLDSPLQVLPVPIEMSFQGTIVSMPPGRVLAGPHHPVRRLGGVPPGQDPGLGQTQRRHFLRQVGAKSES